MESTRTRSDAPARRKLRFDEQGRAIPFTEAELDEMAQTGANIRAAMEAIPDDPPGSDQEFMKAIDEERPERPLFRGHY